MATLNSMTGFAAVSADIDGGVVSLELRAVNSRFLDLAFRMGEDFRSLEPAIRERLGEHVKRGKLECRVNFTPREATLLPSEPNAALLAQLAQLAAKVMAAMPEARPPGVTELLRWPGMLGDSGVNSETLQATALRLLQDALRDFNASRAQEGKKLAATIQQRVEAMRALVVELRP